jgi:hypothetical protein
MSDEAETGFTPTPQMVPSGDRELLAGLMSLAGARTLAGAKASRDRSAATWTDSEMAAIWRHQLDAPLLVDLGGLSADAGATVTMHAQQGTPGRELRSFGDLIRHPQPPLELLKLAKEFAKAQRYAQGTDFPVETALVIYYASIVLALLRAGQRITEMTDADLRGGIAWSSQQQWLDAKTQALFEEALANLPTIHQSKTLSREE